MKHNLGELNWIIKDSQGKVIGPFSKEAIFNLIDRGILNGEETIAIYPDGAWMPFARDIDFFDRLMDSLEGKRGLLKPSSYQKMEENTVVMHLPNKEIIEDSTSLIGEKTQTQTQLPIKNNEKKKMDSLIQNNFHPDKKYKVKINNSSEISPNKKKTKSNKKESRKVDPLFILFFMILLSVLYLAFSEKETKTVASKIHLLAPSKTTGTISKADFARSISLVRGLLESDNFSDWVESQNILVKLAEGMPENTEIREMICFVHKELWAFAYQDVDDLRVLNTMTQTTRNINPGALHGRSCQMIQSLLTGKTEEAKHQLDQLLVEAPDSTFYAWIKSDILLSEKDFINAQGFATSVINVWPNFLRQKMILAHTFEGLGQFDKAEETYKQIISKNPKHKLAKIYLGILEFENFHANERAWTTLSSALNSSDLVPFRLEARAYKDLAEMSLIKNQTNLARKYIEKAYSLDPNEPTIQELNTRLGGQNKIEVKDGKTAELLALGDQSARNGDCFAAQAQYRAAFDIDQKSGLAALKAAKCLWKINQSLDAIDYLKKAIENNPSFFPAYTQLVDFYSQRYDFSSAARVLSQAKVGGEDSPELIRAQAYLEYRKNNYKVAIGLAQKAVKIYDTDIETHLLLAQSYLGSGQVREAFHSAAHAIELDSVNTEAQVIYAQVLHSYQGVDSAINYLDNLIKQYDNIFEYKLALANVFKKEEKFPNALIMYQQVVGISPKHKGALIGIGESYQGMGQMEKGLSSFLTASTVDPTDPEALFKAGLLYFETARFGPAIQQFERVLQVNTYYPRVRYLIAKAAFAQGDIEKALNFASAEKKQNPNLAESYLLLGDIYFATRKYPLCTAEYQQAIKIQPQGASIYVKIARCYRLSGSYDVASSMIEIATQKESGYPEIYREKGAIFQALGENDTAYVAYEKYIALAPNSPDRAEVESIMNVLQPK